MAFLLIKRESGGRQLYPFVDGPTHVRMHVSHHTVCLQLPTVWDNRIRRPHCASDLLGGSLVQDYTVSAEICPSFRHNSRRDNSDALMRRLSGISKRDGRASGLTLPHYGAVKHFQFVPQRNTDTKYLLKLPSITPCVSTSV